MTNSSGANGVSRYCYVYLWFPFGSAEQILSNFSRGPYKDTFCLNYIASGQPDC